MPTIAEQISKKSTTPSSNIAEALEGYNGGGGGGGSTTPMESTTWEALVAKCNGGTLTPGMQYRITDYVCTTTQDESRAVSHPFDIIVTADDEHTLNENARACMHDGDNYYSAEGHQADLSSWELKYCIDNDTTRFAWADTTNGRGVIYWLKDNRNNECPYDFKQIQFKRYKITECTVSSLVGECTTLQHGNAITGIDEQNPVWCYTFSYDPKSTGVMSDASVIEFNSHNRADVSENIIKVFYNYKAGLNIAYLNNVVLFGYSCNSNALGDNCFNNTLVDNCSNNTFGNSCNSNTLGHYCSNNTFGNSCNSNTFGNNCSNNTFGNSCNSNTFGNSCNSNALGDNCSNTTFGNGFTSNTLGDSCNSNTFGNGCNSNALGDNCSNTTFGDYCGSNTLGDNCSNNTFGNNCFNNTFGNSSSANTFGNYCSNNTIGNICNSNALGDNCSNNTFGNSCNGINISAGTSSKSKRYYHVLDGVEGISITGTDGNNFVTYVGKNSSGALKTWVPANLIQ